MGIRKLLLLSSLKALITVSVSDLLSDGDQQYALSYLKYYGYLPKSSTSSTVSAMDSVSQALKIFQSYWSLQVDGTLNRETLSLMNSRRCGMPDDVLEFNVHKFKWNKKELTWYFHAATQKQIETAQKAFSEWSKITRLTFYNVRYKHFADIIISFGQKQHTFISDWSLCEYRLGNGTIGHAYLPDKRNTMREIHLAKEDDWEMGLGKIPKDHISLYWVLLHEIGHTLGIDHSTVENSIMFPVYRNRNSTEEYSFDYDDINAAQLLYNNTKNDFNADDMTTPSVVTTTTTTITETSIVEKLNADSICKVPLEDLKFFIFRKRMYVFYKQWVWPLNLDVKKRKYENPQLIQQWLTFLPRNFSKITAIYERSSGDIALFSNNIVYVFNPDSLKLLADWPKTYQTAFSSSIDYDDIQAAVLTNNGKTYIVNRGIYVMEIDECTFKPRKYYLFSDLFKGAGASGLGAFNFSFFKYTNGKIYLLKDDHYYEYDEYNEEVTKFDTLDLSMFDIECPIENTVTKLRRLMSKLLFFYDKDKSVVGELQRKKDRVKSFDSVTNLRNHMRSYFI